MSDDYEDFLSLGKHLPALSGDGWRGSLRRNLEAAMGLPRTRRLLAEMEDRIRAGDPVFEALLGVSGIAIDAPGVVDAIPASGAVVVVSNHPFGGADAAVMAALATRARPDTRILANAELLGMPGLGDWLFPLRILGEAGAARAN
ncbi:MAG: hypothetical protein HKO57_17260, partial [Akkermansiaceae bacterium]|nr:hypothetical protein [Akkermansiaceae bacterium]